MKNFCHPDWGLLPEALAEQAHVYFFYGNFYRLLGWEEGENPEISGFIRHYYTSTGGREYWGFKFERDRLMHAIASKADKKLFCAQSSESALVQYSLGRYFHFRTNTSSKQRESAFFWYHLSAQQGCPFAMLSLAYCYRKGIGVLADLAQSVQWEQKYNANHRNYSFSLTPLPRRYPPYRIATGLWELEQRTNSGCLIARMQLAYCYLYGLGVAHDLHIPLKWCEETIHQLEKKQASGKKLSKLEVIAQQAALELLGCYKLQGVTNLIKPNFWQAAALKIMSTVYRWEGNSDPSHIPIISLTESETAAIKAVERRAEAFGLQQDEDEILLFPENQDDWTKEHFERIEEFYDGSWPTSRAQEIAESICRYHPLQLKRTYAENIFDARAGILKLIKRYGVSKEYSEINPFCFGCDANNPPRCHPDQDSKFWIFYIQTRGLNLVFQHFKGRCLKPDGRKLAFLTDVGQRSFQVGNYLFSDVSQRLNSSNICYFFDLNVQLKMGQYGLNHYLSMAQDYQKEGQASLTVYAFSAWPSERTIQLIVEEILKPRFFVGHASKLLDQNGYLDDFSWPVTEFENFLQQMDNSLAKDHFCEFIESVQEPKRMAYWFRRQHLLLTYFLKVSFYIHDPWIKKQSWRHLPYRPDLQKLARYLKLQLRKVASRDVQAYLVLLLERLKRNAHSIPKPEFFYPALGWSKYWKQALLTLTPFEKIDRLDCAPFRDGLFCSD